MSYLLIANITAVLSDSVIPLKPLDVWVTENIAVDIKVDWNKEY
ncbi:MAG TPA: hypothetical protein VIJ25_12530 [Methylococcales bacterium]